MRLLKIQFTFLWTKKLFLIFHLLFLLICGLLLSVSNLLSTSVTQSFNAIQFARSYQYTSIFYIKLVVVLLIILLVVYAFFMNEYDVYLVTNKNKIVVLLSKLLTLYILLIYFLTIMYLVFLVLKMLMPIATLSIIDLSVYGYLCLFTGYYLVLSVLVVYLYKHIFVIIVPIIGYLLSILTNDVDITIGEMNGFSRFIQIWFLDVLYIDSQYTLLYGPIFVLSFLLFLMICLIRIYVKKDII